MRDRRERGDRKRNTCYVVFTAYESKENLEKDENAVEFHLHIRQLILKNRIKKPASPDEADWFDFTVIIGAEKYWVDERTFRRLLSCQSH